MGNTGDQQSDAARDGNPGKTRLEGATASSLEPGDRLSIIRNPEDFFRLETRWRELEAAAQPGRHVFQTFDWLSTWIRAYGSAPGASPLSIALGLRGSRLVFAWPLMQSRGRFLTVLRWLSEPVSQYGDVLVSDGESPDPWLAAALGHFITAGGIDAIRLRHVRGDAVVSPFLQTRFRSARMTDLAPWLDLTAYRDEAAYEAGYTSVQRKRRRKIRKALEDDFGPVSFSRLQPGPLRDEAIASAIAHKSRWIEARGRHNRVLGCSRITGFFQNLGHGRWPGAELVVTELSAGGRPISWEIGLRHKATHYAFITSHRGELTDYSPPRLHMDFSQRLALRDGMKAFDLMMPNDAYKQTWCSDRAVASDYYLPVSAKGHAYGTLYLERLRPFLRERYYRMSPVILKLVKPVIGH